ETYFKSGGYPEVYLDNPTPPAPSKAQRAERALGGRRQGVRRGHQAFDAVPTPARSLEEWVALRDMALSVSSAGVSGGRAAASGVGGWMRRGAAPHSSRWRPPAIRCIGWDPEGILGPPRGGHISRLEIKRRLEKDTDAREAFNRQVLEEKERRRALRQSRVVPETVPELLEYFLDTDARELEYEIARLRPRLNKELFDHLQLELAQLRFAVNRTKEMEDRLIELDAMQKVLLEGTEAYDKMQEDLVLAKERLARILQSKDRKATVWLSHIFWLLLLLFYLKMVSLNMEPCFSQLLEMVERNELRRSVLALLDENIASAIQNNQVRTFGPSIALEIP
ncbi:hypothetical protein Taro_021815, partial [Colocasia esculenta]|nr:hypothetical protein [Colocasia esculenta]